MSVANFSRWELRRIVQACAPIEIDDCTPPYLQDFIATRLADIHPELSTKIRQLSSDEMHELCEYIRQNQSPVS
jgi:hypothetical protein